MLGSTGHSKQRGLLSHRPAKPIMCEGLALGITVLFGKLGAWWHHLLDLG